MYCLMNTKNDAFEMCYVETVGEYNCGGYALGLNVWYVPYLSFRLLEDIYESVEYELDYQQESWEEEPTGENAALFNKAKFNYDYVENRMEQTEDEFIALLTEYLGKEPDDDDRIAYENWVGDEVVDFSAWVMAKVFPWVRVIESFDELEDDEYGVIFAVGDWDFHFVRRDIYDGEICWSHKMGGGPIEDLECPNDGFGGRYNSKRVFLAVVKEDYR